MADTVAGKLAEVYAAIGSDRGVQAIDLPKVVPRHMRASLDRFVDTVASRETDLRNRAAAVDVLDEAA